jgi:tubulin---tyrosine ligase
VKRRPWCQLVYDIESSKAEDGLIQISDFEMIEWDPVLEGKHRASSYIIRKGIHISFSHCDHFISFSGLSRKAQLALQLKRFTCKHPQSILHSAVPFTLIVQTWNAFDEMKLDLGGGFFASFDNSSGGSFFMQSSLRQRLEWSLADIQEEVTMEGREGWIWILKPSVTNKGTNISVHRSWETILDALEEESDVREWVLQRSLPPSLPPLLMPSLSADIWRIL